MKSFEICILRFFDNSTTHKPPKGDESCFNQISLYADWDLPNDGYLKCLKEEIDLFDQAH